MVRPHLLAAFGLAVLAHAGVASAELCNDASTCASGFCVDDVCCDAVCDGLCEACSALAKGQGEDGVCELVVAGTVCTPSFCDPNGFAFIAAETCDAGGSCIDGGGPQSCFQSDGVCAKDLCHDEEGCQVAIMPDGIDCGGGMVCLDGACDGVAGTGGSGGDGGGSGGMEEGGTGGTGGSGVGGAGGALGEGGTTVSADCECSAAGAPGGGGGFAVVGLALVFARRRRA